MSDKAKPEFSLDQFSEAETDEEFGLPEFKEHFADTLTPAILRDWTAKDFASIYVRFRPHLERHARRFLANPSQVEEVVQDAFLYLMTTLPELDSELGVLKFLKWKVRLLSLDVIRANSRASISPLEELPDIESDEPETSQGLERAEDAAIVSMALAKLQPRQREALIATLYEEKSTEVVASQMGLSENAFRQLLLRARRSFKLALIGEANVAGLTVTQILSVAAKKAAANSKSIRNTLVTFVVLSGLAGIYGQGILGPDFDNSANLSSAVESMAVPGSDGDPKVIDDVPSIQPEAEIASLPNEESASRQETEELFLAGATDDSLRQPAEYGQPQNQVDESPSEAAEQEEDTELLAGLSPPTVEKLSALVSASNSTSDYSVDNGTHTLRVTSEAGVAVSVGLSSIQTVPTVDFVWIELEFDEFQVIGVPRSIAIQRLSEDPQQQHYQIVVTEIVFADVSGEHGYQTVGGAALGKNAFVVEFNLSQGDFSGEPVLSVSNRLSDRI